MEDNSMTNDAVNITTFETPGELIKHLLNNKMKKGVYYFIFEEIFCVLNVDKDGKWLIHNEKKKMVK